MLGLQTYNTRGRQVRARLERMEPIRSTDRPDEGHTEAQTWFDEGAAILTLLAEVVHQERDPRSVDEGAIRRWQAEGRAAELRYQRKVGEAGDLRHRESALSPEEVEQAIADGEIRPFVKDDESSAESFSGGDLTAKILDQAVIFLRELEPSAEVEHCILGGPSIVLGEETWDSLTPEERDAALSICRIGWAVRVAELEMVPDASDRVRPGWLVIGKVVSDMIDQYSDVASDDSLPVTAVIASAHLFASQPSTIKGLYESAPGLSPEIRWSVVHRWLARLNEREISPSRIRADQQASLFAYGYALGVVREFCLVAQERGDAEREGREPRL